MKAFILLVLMTMIVSLTTVFAGGNPTNPHWQCRNIGKSKVKPYRFKHITKKPIAMVPHTPRFRAYEE